MPEYPEGSAANPDEIQVTCFDVLQGILLQPIASHPTSWNPGSKAEPELHYKALISKLLSQSSYYKAPITQSDVQYKKYNTVKITHTQQPIQYRGNQPTLHLSGSIWCYSLQAMPVCSSPISDNCPSEGPSSDPISASEKGNTERGR